MIDHAIQRWSVGWESAYCQEPRAVPPASPPENEGLWCKSKDVEQLEALIISYLKTISELRTEVTHQRQEIEKLKEYKWMYENLG